MPSTRTAKIEARAEALEYVFDSLKQTQRDLERLAIDMPSVALREEIARLGRDLEAARTLLSSVLADCAISAQRHRRNGNRT